MLVPSQLHFMIMPKNQGVRGAAPGKILGYVSDFG
jgi:hypothetical protein